MSDRKGVNGGDEIKKESPCHFSYCKVAYLASLALT
jgi:hypothetical protein